MKVKRVVVGFTGASGAIYGRRLLWHLRRLGHETHLIVTPMGRKVAAHEGEAEAFDLATQNWSPDDLMAGPASGSWACDGMVVIPCSMGTLGRIAHGVSDNLLTRAADVRLKERQPLVLVPREMPYSLIHLENMATITRAGGIILPASPSFYGSPGNIEDLVDTVVGRVLDHLGVDQEIGPRWGG